MASMASTVVLQALTNACSQDPTLLKRAEDELKSWETQPGFYTTLMSIYVNHSVDVNVRWLAVVCLKNGVDRYWRNNVPNALSQEEKIQIKNQLLCTFNEPVQQIASQIAVLVAKVARIESKSWTELMPAILQGLQQSDSLHRQRSLLIFQHVVKMMASKRLYFDKEIFRELASSAFDFVFNNWSGYVTVSIEQIMSQNTSAYESIQALLLTTKVLKKFLVHGWKEFGPDSQPMTFIKQCLETTKQFVELRRKLLENQSLVALLEKLIVLLAKLILSIQEYHPLSCVPLLQDMLQFSAFYVFTNCGTELVFERFIVHCCNLMKSIVKCESYNPPKEVTDSVDQLIIQAHQIQKVFFTSTVLSEIITTLVSHYFLLTKQDLELWDSDPEDFDNEDVGESWRYQLRPSTEVFLLSLFSEFRALVGPIIVSIINSAQGFTEIDDFRVLLQREAVYNVAGLSSYDLFEEINFEEWFSQHLIKELQNKSSNHRIIRRRVIWLVGQWIDVKFSPAHRPMLYQILVDLMNESEDLVVRLSASKTLRLAVDDVEFRTEDFLPYLESSVSLLFKLLCDVKECDTKMHVLFVMSTVIERVGSKIKPYAGSLVSYLPQLWQESEEHNMLRCSILSTLVNLVQGLGSESAHIYPFLIPVIQLSTDVNQPAHVYLLEDGLELWSNTLKYALSITPELLQLFNNMPHLLELSSDNLRTSFSIVESYVLLTGLEFLQVWGRLIVGTCESLLGTMKAEGNIVLARIVEVIFRRFPVEGPTLLESILPKIFKCIVDGQEYGPLLAVYISLFAIILLKNPSYFYSFVENVAKQCGKLNEEMLRAFIDAWLERMDSIIKPERRKLSALALFSMFSIKRKVLQERFPVIIETVVDVLHELNKGDNFPADCLLMNPDDDIPDDEYNTQEYLRRRELNLQDPVHTVKLANFVRDVIHQCQREYGEQDFQMMLQSVESSVVQDLQSFINCPR